MEEYAREPWYGDGHRLRDSRARRSGGPREAGGKGRGCNGKSLTREAWKLHWLSATGVAPPTRTSSKYRHRGVAQEVRGATNYRTVALALLLLDPFYFFVSQKRNAGQIYPGAKGGQAWSQYPQGFLAWLFPS